MKYSITISFTLLLAVHASEGPSQQETKISPGRSGALITTFALASTLAVLSATAVRKNQRLRSRMETTEDVYKQTANQSKNDLEAARAQIAELEAALAEEISKLQSSNETVQELNAELNANIATRETQVQTAEEQVKESRNLILEMMNKVKQEVVLMKGDIEN